MARNDVYLNINALSPADAVVTGQQDMTAATVPELVLGDTPTFNFYFTDNTNVWPSWAGNAAYTVTWALSDAVSGDFSPAATTGNATPITGGWSVVLPLNAYDLVGLLNTKRVSQPYPVTNLWQQLRVTDPSGNEITRAMFWTPVRYRAISDTQNTESASPTGGRFVAVNNVNTLTTPTAAQFYAANPVPTSALGTAANGELLIGNGTGFTKSTLTAGTGITVTNGSGSITIDATGAQETLTATVKNAESVAITKGQVVYLFGATGGFASVKLAYNTSDATSAKTFGVVSDTSISPNGTGTVTCVGVVDGLNLGAYQDGDTLYLGATPGSVTATKPYAPNHLVYVGIVERANAGNGELYVRVQNGYELDEIHDVQINAPRQSGQTLIYDNTTSLWKNARITAGSNIAVTNGDGSISIGFSGTLPVANGGTGVTSSTGSGSVVLSTSPTLTTPILGTPQSGTLSSCTGLPISTGVSGLGTNVATFLETPSSTNLASAVTDETGTGALVFANTPTLVTPNIGAATGTSVNLSGAGTFGGNLTVSGGTMTVSGADPRLNINRTSSGSTAIGFQNTGTAIGFMGVATGAGNLVADAAANDMVVRSNAGNTIRLNTDGGTATQFSVDSTKTTVSGNLTVSGGTITGGTSGMSLASGGTNQNITLTPSGTGSILLGSNGVARGQTAGVNKNGSTGPASSGTTTNAIWRVSNVSNSLVMDIGLNGAASPYPGYIQVSDYSNLATSYPLSLNPNGGNVLIGTTTDGGQKLQVSGSALIYAASNTHLKLDNASDQRYTSIYFNNGGVQKAGLYWDNATGTVFLDSQAGSSSIKLHTSNTLALTLDSSQNATFAGTVTTNKAYQDITSGLSTIYVYSTSSATQDQGGTIQLGGAYTGTTTTGFGGLRGSKESTTAGETGGQLEFFTRANGGAMARRAYISSTGDATFAGTVIANKATTAFRIPTAETPASASATGTVGTITWDASYIYVCTAANTWKRVAIATW